MNNLSAVCNIISDCLSLFFKLALQRCSLSSKLLKILVGSFLSLFAKVNEGSILKLFCTCCSVIVSFLNTLLDF